jgi:hypothetical protein
MIYFHGNRYITKGALKILGPSIIQELWHLLDRLIQTNQIQLDYLQIFNLETKVNNNDYLVLINHNQEVPPYEKQEIIKLNKRILINQKVYIISDIDEHGNEYSTMLLSSEY